MLKWTAIPLKEVNGVVFGMSRSEVRVILGDNYKEFKKNKFSKTTTDDFGICHVFYSIDGKCEAIEIFDGCEISVNGKPIFPIDISSIKGRIDDLEEDAGSFISKKLSIGIYAPKGTPESILFGIDGYYR